VSLAPSCTESLLAIGAHARLVGIEEHSELPAELCAVPRVGGFKHVDFERVASLAPDLIVAASSARGADCPAPRVSTRTRIFVSQPRTSDSIIRRHGPAGFACWVSHEPRRRTIARARHRIDMVLERTLRGGPRPLVYVEFSPRGHTGGPQSFLDDLVTQGGWREPGRSRAGGMAGHSGRRRPALRPGFDRHRRLSGERDAGNSYQAPRLGPVVRGEVRPRHRGNRRP
jgi:hypothetical protein